MQIVSGDITRDITGEIVYLKHKPAYKKGWGWRCRYCGKTYKDLREEAEYKERERRSRTW